MHRKQNTPIQSHYRILIGVVFCLLVMGVLDICAQSQKNKTISNRSSGKQKTPTPQQKIDAEARTMANKLIDTHFTKCGDSYFMVVLAFIDSLQVELQEIKGLTIEITPRMLSAADKLNGLEWKGWVGIKFKAYRYLHRSSQGEWYKAGQWYDGVDGPGRYGGALELSKKSDQSWNVPGLNGNSKMKCEDIPASAK